MNTPAIRPSLLEAAWEVTVGIVALTCFLLAILCIGIFGSKETIAQADAIFNGLEDE